MGCGFAIKSVGGRWTLGSHGDRQLPGAASLTRS